MSPFLSRVKPDDHFAGRRGDVYDLVCAEPGINFMSVAERTRLGIGATAYHLQALEHWRHVQSFRAGRFRRYYPAGQESYQRNRIHAALAAPAYLETARYVLEHPGAHQAQVAERFPALSRQAVGYRLARLADAGAITRTAEGSRRYYHATMDGAYVLDHLGRTCGREESTYAAEPSALRSVVV